MNDNEDKIDPEFYIPLAELDQKKVLERLIYLEKHSDGFVVAQAIAWAKQERPHGSYITVWETIAVDLAHRLQRKGG